MEMILKQEYVVKLWAKLKDLFL